MLNFNLYFHRDRRKNDLEAILGSKVDAGPIYKSSNMKDMEKEKLYVPRDTYMANSDLKGLPDFSIIVIKVNLYENNVLIFLDKIF